MRRGGRAPDASRRLGKRSPVRLRMAGSAARGGTCPQALGGPPCARTGTIPTGPALHLHGPPLGTGIGTLDPGLRGRTGMEACRSFRRALAGGADALLSLQGGGNSLGEALRLSRLLFPHRRALAEELRAVGNVSADGMEFLDLRGGASLAWFSGSLEREPRDAPLRHSRDRGGMQRSALPAERPDGGIVFRRGHEVGGDPQDLPARSRRARGAPRQRLQEHLPCGDRLDARDGGRGRLARYGRDDRPAGHHERHHRDGFPVASASPGSLACRRCRIPSRATLLSLRRDGPSGPADALRFSARHGGMVPDA